MSARLTHLDGSFLRVETPNAHMHVAWSGLFEPAPDHPRPTVEALREKVAARLHLVPRFRQRLAGSPLPLSEPVWADDPGFDVRRHVTALGEDAEPSVARFRELTDAALSRPLSRTGPLWHIHLAPRLEDGRTGLLFKIHHALVDGKSAVELALLLFDTTPEGVPEESPEWSPAPTPSAARLTLDAVVDGAAEPLRAARGLARMAASPGEAGFTGTLRRAALAGALRELALDRGEQPQPLKAMVPVSMRAEDERGRLGNRISFAFVELPVHVRSRGARLEQVHAATAEFKRSGRAAGTQAVLGALGLLPAALLDGEIRALARPPRRARRPAHLRANGRRDADLRPAPRG